MEQLNRLTRSLRRARTVELPDGERGRAAGSWGRSAGPGEAGGKRTESRPDAHVYFRSWEGPDWDPRAPGARRSRPSRWGLRGALGCAGLCGRMAGTRVPETVRLWALFPSLLAAGRTLPDSTVPFRLPGASAASAVGPRRALLYSDRR